MFDEHGHQLSIVVQGRIGSAAESTLLWFRRSVPCAQIIVSTFPSYENKAHGFKLAGLADEVVISEDPGPLPPTVKTGRRPNNFNRMLISSRAGLAQARGRHALKIRGDASVDPVAVMKAWANGGACQRLLFASRYTRHPFGINGYLFHVSDWLTFGLTQRVLQYWSAPLMTQQEATYFERHPMPDRAVASSRRFRSLMTQEQWVCTHYARALGYDTVERLAQRSDHLIQQYCRFLANECIIADAATIGLRLPGHERAVRSWFQRIDCVSEHDWRCIREQVERSCRVDATGWRRLSFALRHAISRGVLLKLWCVDVLKGA